ncbi:MAG: nodulation protein NfeD [Desulfurococcales archaeon]|nr:nodulation protein NfeD [Desulfurococcales archaeon]
MDGKAVKVVFLALILTAILATSLLVRSSEAQQGDVVTTALVVKIAPPWDTIDDGVKECVINALQVAERNNYALILEVDSYGGLLDAGFSIGDALATSKAPVIAYVYDGKALSAASLIILPANVIALSPNAVIGDMQPIMYNPTTGQITFVNESKIVNPVITKAVAYARLRGRNTTAVELFVKGALTMTADEAVKNHVADLIVNDFEDLLSKLKGLEVKDSGRTYVLQITNTLTYRCSVRARTISLFENPLISGLMMTLGVLGTLFAILSGKLPILPVAILFLLLGMLGSGFSPNLVAISFLVLGAVLLAVELFVTPGFGVLGISGIVLIALGVALSPVNIPAGTSPPPGYANQLRILALTVGAVLGGFTGFVLYKIIEVKRRKPSEFTPVEGVGRAVDPIGPGRPGYIMVNGEYWKATSDTDVSPGQRVKVVAMVNGVLKVEPVEGDRDEGVGNS